MIKIKASSILKMYSQIMSSLHNARQQNDIIVLPQERYANFMHLWMEYNTSHQGQLETVIKCFFRGLFLLLENQLLLELYNNLDESARNQRRYFRPIKSIEKPKNIEQFTLIDRRYGEINWQSLTVPVFKLKYRVIENDNYYLCYRMKE